MRALFGRLFPYCLQHKLLYLAGLLAVVAANLPIIKAYVWVGRTTDYILLPGITAQGVLWRLGTILILVAIGTIGMYFQRIFLVCTSRLVEFELRNDFFRHLTNLSPSFYDRSKTGDIVARATSDIDLVRTALGPGILYPLTALVIVPGTLYEMFAISGPVTWTSLTPMLLLPGIVATMAHLTYKRSLRVQEHFSEFSGRIQESITGIRVIKSFVQRDHELGILDKGNERNAELNMHLAKLQAGFFPMLISLLIFGIITILWTSSRYISDNPEQLAANPDFLTKGQLLAVILLYRNFFFPTLRLGWVISALQRAAASMKRLDLIWKIEPAIRDSEDTDTSIQNVQGGIEFRRLTFTYPHSEHPALRDMDLRIEAGNTLGIVGSVGSGKSTVAHLIARLYDPEPGTVLIDGHDVRKVPLSVLRSNIGMVFQETYLFSDTIRANISFGLASEAGADDVAAAAGVAAVDDDIDHLPDRYDTVLGERGVNLSGGQKQRVSLARAIAPNRPILILDDAFSSVDTNTEERILRGLEPLMRERTTILISHRISTVKMADEIIVLDDGRIAERGTHDELVALNGLYADTYQRQLLERAIEAEDKG